MSVSMSIGLLWWMHRNPVNQCIEDFSLRLATQISFPFLKTNMSFQRKYKINIVDSKIKMVKMLKSRNRVRFEVWSHLYSIIVRWLGFLLALFPRRTSHPFLVPDREGLRSEFLVLCLPPKQGFAPPPNLKDEIVWRFLFPHLSF